MTKSEAWAIEWAREIAPTVHSDVNEIAVIESHLRAALLIALESIKNASEMRAAGAFRMDVTSSYVPARIL